MIEIIVKAKSGHGKSTIASNIAAYLQEIGFNVMVDDIDEIGPKFLGEERLQGIVNNSIYVKISTEQILRS